MTLSDRIRGNVVRLREAKGWSRPELGRRLNPQTSGSQIERLEKGWRGLDTEWIDKLATALGVDPIELLTDGAHPQELTPQVASEVAAVLARIVLGGEPKRGTVEVLALLIEELSATFAAYPEARHDPHVARPVIDLVARRFGKPS